MWRKLKYCNDKQVLSKKENPPELNWGYCSMMRNKHSYRAQCKLYLPWDYENKSSNKRDEIL